MVHSGAPYKIVKSKPTDIINKYCPVKKMFIPMSFIFIAKFDVSFCQEFKGRKKLSANVPY